MSKSKLKKQGFELSEVNIIQAAVSDIRHRSDCDTYIEMCGRKVLPVIVAPMGAVTDETNYKIWLDNNFICVVPRTVDFDKRIEISKETFVSFSLGESESLCDAFNDNEKHYICIDIAHGTMQSLYDVCEKLKNKFGDKIIIMTGNIANPDAYDFYAKNSIDYIRVSIGDGSRCFVAGTKITMADGSFENIENIDAGDFVKTTNGNKKVVRTFQNKTKSTLLINNEIETTPNHKFLVVKKTDIKENYTDDEILNKAFYLEAKLLNGNFLLVKE